MPAGFLAVATCAHAAPAALTALGRVNKQPAAARTCPNALFRQNEQRFDREQRKRGAGLRRACPGCGGHFQSAIFKKWAVLEHADRGGSKKGTEGLLW